MCECTRGWSDVGPQHGAETAASCWGSWLFLLFTDKRPTPRCLIPQSNTHTHSHRNARTQAHKIKAKLTFSGGKFGRKEIPWGSYTKMHIHTHTHKHTIRFNHRQTHRSDTHTQKQAHTHTLVLPQQYTVWTPVQTSTLTWFPAKDCGNNNPGVDLQTLTAVFLFISKPNQFIFNLCNH